MAFTDEDSRDPFDLGVRNDVRMHAQEFARVLITMQVAGAHLDYIGDLMAEMIRGGKCTDPELLEKIRTWQDSFASWHAALYEAQQKVASNVQ